MIAITFDTDWIVESAIKELNLIDSVPGNMTFFCTDYYPYLDGQKKVEIGLHPRLEWGSDWIKETKDLEKKFNAPIYGIRPHSLSYTQMYGIELAKMGYKYISQATYLYHQGLKLDRHPWGIYELPIYYMDSMDFTFQLNWETNNVPFRFDIIEKAIYDEKGLYIFDFHPIHLLLNSPSIQFYHDNRNNYSNAKPYNGRGTKTFFDELCSEMKKNNVFSHSLIEIVNQSLDKTWS